MDSRDLDAIVASVPTSSSVICVDGTELIGTSSTLRELTSLGKGLLSLLERGLIAKESALVIIFWTAQWVSGSSVVARLAWKVC